MKERVKRIAHAVLYFVFLVVVFNTVCTIMEYGKRKDNKEIAPS